MKKKFSRIVALVLSLVLALALAVPVIADVSQPQVSVDPKTISATSTYTINFMINDELVYNAVKADCDYITVEFPDDTDIDNVTEADITMSGTSGIGSDPFSAIAVTVCDEDYDDLTLEIYVPNVNAQGKIGAMASVQLVIADVINPTEPGDYTLMVMTSEEDEYVESTTYEIKIPTVGGGVYVYNKSMILLDTFGGSAAIMDAYTHAGLYFEKEEYTIRVEPGTYKLTGDIDIDGKDLVFESTGGPEDTTIDADGYDIDLNGEGCIIDGFTIDDADEAVDINGDKCTVQNCVITDASSYGVVVDGGEDAEIKDNVIEDCACGIYVNGIDAVIEGNEITETSTDPAIYVVDGAEDTDIKDNTITGNDEEGIELAGVTDDTLISGNTISENEEQGILVGGTPTGLVITGNDIIDGEDDGIEINAWDQASCGIIFNNIHDNKDNVDNNQAGNDVLAVMNWWGSTDSSEIEDELKDQDPKEIDYKPYLMGAVEETLTGMLVKGGVTDLDAEDEAGVVVDGATDSAIIAAAGYVSNPGADVEDALAYYDVLAHGALDDPTIKFYTAGADKNSEIKIWSDDTDAWVTLDTEYSSYGGYVYAEDVDAEMLGGTPFVVVEGKAPAPDVLGLHAPEAGSDTALTNIPFTWASHEDATSYELVISAAADMSSPIVKVTTAGTAYTYSGILTDGTPYYWQVTALDETKVEGRSDVGTFIAKAPVEPTPPVVIEPSEPPVIEPVIEIPPSPLTPGIVWAIIAIGAVLVIAVIVLIVRTRRVT